MDTVTAQIEHHSWLERQGKQFNQTTVFFEEKLSQNTVFLAIFSPKMTIVQDLNILDFDSTLALYLHGYGK